MNTSANTGPMQRWGRLGGASGIVFVAMALAGGLIQGDVPVYTQGPMAIKAWFADNADSYLVGAYLLFFGACFFLVFLAVLVAVLTHADDAHSPWPRLALLTGALTFVAVMGSVGFDPTLAVLEGDVSDDLARALSAGDYMTFMLFYPLCGIFALTVSVIALRTGMLWRPLAWFGALIALGGLVALTASLQHDAEGALTTVGYVTLLAFLVWTVGVAVSMMRAGRRQ